MRWDENGTETGTLINPHLPHVHYMALKRVFDPTVQSMQQCMMDQMSDAHQLLCLIITAELESNPLTSWNRVRKVLIGKLIKYGVWGR